MSQSIQPLDNHNLMTVKETAEYLRMPLPSVYYHAQRGNIPTIKIGGRWRVLRDRLNAEFLKIVPENVPGNMLQTDRDEMIDIIALKVIRTLEARFGRKSVPKGTKQHHLLTAPHLG